jgi:AP endonuclease-1
VKKEADKTPPADTAKDKKKRAPAKKESDDVKPKKARKSKKDQELESMPLALRTKGLRMFVGAHVSAAKGQCSNVYRLNAIITPMLIEQVFLIPYIIARILGEL